MSTPNTPSPPPHETGRDGRPRPRRRPQQARSRITVGAILEAGIQVLTSHGYDDLTTTRVAERAGVSVGTLYQYFPNKAALVAALVEDHLAREAAALDQALKDAEGLPFHDVVERLVRAFVDVFAVAPKRSGALYAQVPRVHWSAGVQDVARQVTEQLVALFQKNPDALRVPDLELAAFLIVRAVDAMAQRAASEQPEALASGAVAREAVVLAQRYLLPDDA